MLRKLSPLSLLTVLFIAPLLHAQTSTATQIWFTVAPESETTSVTIPAGTTYRFGDYTNNRWSAPITVTAPTTFRTLSFNDGVFPFQDPDEGTVKEFDVLKTTSTQFISVTNLAATPQLTMAEVIPPLVPPASVPVVPGTSYSLTFSNFSVAPGNAQNALMLAFVNAPPSASTSSWVGTQMNLTIDGVTFTCTYGQTYTEGVFTLNCTVPPPTPTTQVASNVTH